jgi:periplasmic mercuric ion binding protein
MKKGKIINVVLVTAVVVLLGVVAFSIRIRPTADNVAVLRTAGMTCGGCSADIEKALQAQKGVASVEVDVTGGWVIVGYDSKKIKPEALVSTVSGAGFGSRVERLLSVEQFRTMTGRNPGGDEATKIGCGCDDGN